MKPRLLNDNGNGFRTYNTGVGVLAHPGGWIRVTENGHTGRGRVSAADRLGSLLLEYRHRLRNVRNLARQGETPNLALETRITHAVLKELNGRAQALGRNLPPHLRTAIREANAAASREPHLRQLITDNFQARFNSSRRLAGLVQARNPEQNAGASPATPTLSLRELKNRVVASGTDGRVAGRIAGRPNTRIHAEGRFVSALSGTRIGDLKRRIVASAEMGGYTVRHVERRPARHSNGEEARTPARVAARTGTPQPIAPRVQPVAPAAVTPSGAGEASAPPVNRHTLTGVPNDSRARYGHLQISVTRRGADGSEVSEQSSVDAMFVPRDQGFPIRERSNRQNWELLTTTSSGLIFIRVNDGNSDNFMSLYRSRNEGVESNVLFF